jgi:chromosome segregation ATPase
MSRVYESLKGVVQETLQRGKGNPASPDSLKDSQGSAIDDKAEEFQRMVSDWMGAFRATVREREAVASVEVQRAEQLIESLKAENTALQAKLANAEELVHVKEASIKDVEHNFKGKIEGLESRIARHEQFWAEHEGQLKTLRSKLELAKNSVKQFEAYVIEAEEALGAIEIKYAAGDSFEPRTKLKQERGEEDNTEREQKGDDQGPRETVPPKFFDRMTTALGHVVGPRAPVIVRDHVASLGESPDRFPKERVPELLDLVSREISDENLKLGFREVVGDGL